LQRIEDLRGCPRVFAHCACVPSRSIITWTNERAVAVAWRLFSARSIVDRWKRNRGGDGRQCSACSLLTCLINDRYMLQGLEMDIVIVIHGVVAAV